MKIGVFPGSFDPFTLGHKAVVNQALEVFDEVVVAAGKNNEKSGCYSNDDKVAMIKKVFATESRVKIVLFDNLTVDVCKKYNATHIIRGLRNSADFEYERNIADTNKVLAPELTTLFFLTPSEYSAISSRIVRDLINYNAQIEKFVPSEIVDDVINLARLNK